MARTLQTRSSMRGWPGMLAASVIVCVSRLARADIVEVKGVVVATDDGDLIVDIGATKGASPAEVVEIWRPIQVRHPVTNQLMTDRFLIGHLKLTQVRPAMSLAAPDGALTRSARVGDVVIAHQNAAPVVAPPTTTTPDAAQPKPPPVVAPPTDADAADLTALFDSLRGAEPHARVERYAQFVKTHPSSRFVPGLVIDMKALQVAMTNARAEQPIEYVTSFTTPEHAYAHTPLHITAELRPKCRGAVLYIATPDRTTFENIPMRAEGNDYFGAIIPSDKVTDTLRVFIEVIDETGKTQTSDGARTIEIAARPEVSLSSPVLATAGIWTDFATYNTRAFNDWTFQTEGYFGARFRDVGFRAVRSGFGVYRGVGGSLNELDTLGLAGRDIGLTYGYLEAEIAFSHIVSIIARAVVGLDQSGVEGGGQAFIRFGNDLGTNLLLGGEVLGGVGVRGIAQLEWNAGKRVPIMFRSEVTNQPAGTPGSATTSGVSESQGDVGVRLIAQVGYRFTERLTIALRASYQGRTINHAGPGGGAAVTYQW